MERRHFLRTMLGVAAATALPSEVWPFKKIFVPQSPEIFPSGLTWNGLDRSPYPGRLPPFPGTVTSEFSRQLLEEEVEAIQLKMFAKEIPNLFFAVNPLYELYRREVLGLTSSGMRLSMRVKEIDSTQKTVTFEAPLPSRRSLLHAPATPENIMEFINGLEDLPKSQG